MPHRLPAPAPAPAPASRITRRALPLLVGGLLLAPGLPSLARAKRRRPKKPKVITKTFTNNAVITIFEDGPSTAWPSAILVSGFKQGKLRDVNLSVLGITHRIASELDMLLQAPNGRKAKVWSDAGDVIGGLFEVEITLDDQAGAPMPQRAEISTGRYRPTNYDSQREGAADPVFTANGGPGDTANVRLATFNGIDPNGNWLLWIGDDTGGDGGTVARGWALQITVEVRR